MDLRADVAAPLEQHGIVCQLFSTGRGDQAELPWIWAGLASDHAFLQPTLMDVHQNRYSAVRCPLDG